jgi:GrpB-like predicted nucleotidyltransferase (UPF0157 family)
LADEIKELLGPLALRVEHIGSTAIPGMAAKPIIDLQGSVADLEQAADAFEGSLAAHGFERLPYEEDHVPAGHSEPSERWSKRMWTRTDPSRDAINLHIRKRGAPNERLALLFRDWFRAHPLAVLAYSQFKSLLSGALSDIGTYTDIKDPVVDLVVVAAEQWALATGWKP